MAVTIPLLLTVATDGSDELQITVLLLAIAGATVALIEVVSPTPTVAVVLFRTTDVSNTLEEVITLLAVFVPSCVVAVMVVLPGETPVNTPF